MILHSKFSSWPRQSQDFTLNILLLGLYRVMILPSKCTSQPLPSHDWTFRNLRLGRYRVNTSQARVFIPSRAAAKTLVQAGHVTPQNLECF